jgi:hypothetical protein
MMLFLVIIGEHHVIGLPTKKIAIKRDPIDFGTTRLFYQTCPRLIGEVHRVLATSNEMLRRLRHAWYAILRR